MVLAPDRFSALPPTACEREGGGRGNIKGQSWLTQPGATSVERGVKAKEEKEVAAAGGVNKRDGRRKQRGARQRANAA